MCAPYSHSRAGPQRPPPEAHSRPAKATPETAKKAAKKAAKHAAKHVAGMTKHDQAWPRGTKPAGGGFPCPAGAGPPRRQESAMAAGVRSFWKGHLRLSLVTIPVRLVSAAKADGSVAFHQVDRKSRQRVRYQKVVPGQGEVEKDDIVRGYEVEPGNYVLLEDEELDALKLETRHTIELTQFVDACEIEPIYFDRPYYLLPDGEVAEEGYRVIRQALLEERKAGIGQLTLRGKENLVALTPSGAGLLLETLRYAEEIKAAEEVFSELGRDPLPADLVAMAKSLIESRSEAFDPTAYENHYARALRDLVEEKVRTGKSVAVGDERTKETGARVVDFMEALRRSVAASGKEAPQNAAAGGAAGKRRAERAPPRAAQTRPGAKTQSKTQSKSKTASGADAGAAKAAGPKATGERKAAQKSARRKAS
jgi:DNA end-binding protein Ku